MDIRPATTWDSEKIWNTQRASIAALCRDHYQEQDIRAWLGVLSPEIYETVIARKVILLAEQNGEVVGLGILDPHHGEIGGVYVHPEHTGKGIGKAILSELEERAQGYSLARLTLFSTLNAEGFHTSQGYIKDGPALHRLPGGRKLDCVKMHKDL